MDSSFVTGTMSNLLRFQIGAFIGHVYIQESNNILLAFWSVL